MILAANLERVDVLELGGILAEPPLRLGNVDID